MSLEMDKEVNKRKCKNDDDLEGMKPQQKVIKTEFLHSVLKLLSLSDVHDFEIEHSDSFNLTTLENALPNVYDNGDVLTDTGLIELLDTTLTDLRNRNIIINTENLNNTVVTPKTNQRQRHISPNSNLSRITKLDEILGSTYEGKGLFRYYNENKSFDELRRKKLAKLIIQFEINKSCTQLSLKGKDKLKEFVITSDQFLEYANHIVYHFPTELTETYFIPGHIKFKKRVLASGRLWDSYNNAKGRLKEEGLLEKKRTVEIENERETVVNTEQKNKNLQRLKVGLTLELQDLLKLWVETFPVRKAYFKDPCKSVSSYFQEFVHLKTDNGKYLIRSDFEQLFPKQSNLFTKRLPNVRNKLIEILGELKNIKGDDKSYLILMPKLDVDHQTAVIFYLLPYLIPVGRKGKQKQGAINKSSVEFTEKGETSQGSSLKNTVDIRQKLLTIIVPKNKTIESEHQKLHQELKKKRETLQPTIFIKNSIIDIKSIKVYIDETGYAVDSYVEAIDLCLKMFFVLDCKYPFPVASVWNFIQKTFYDIDGDKLSPSLYGLCGDLRSLFPA